MTRLQARKAITESWQVGGETFMITLNDGTTLDELPDDAATAAKYGISVEVARGLLS